MGNFFHQVHLLFLFLVLVLKKTHVGKDFLLLFNSQNSLTYLIFSGFEKLEELCVEEKIRGKNRKLGHSYLFVIPIAQKRTKKGLQKQLDSFLKNTRKKNGKKSEF